MATIELRGHITKGGKLEVELPDDLPEGEVKVTIEMPADQTTNHEPLVSLYGILAHLGPAPSEEDIDEIRREMWNDFPRDDIA